MSADENAKIDVLTERIDNLIDHLDRFEVAAEKRFVTREEFSPVQKIIYGGVGIILSAVLCALIALVVFHSTIS